MKECYTERTSGDVLPNYIRVKIYKKELIRNCDRNIFEDGSLLKKSRQKKLWKNVSTTTPWIQTSTHKFLKKRLYQKNWKGISNHPDGNSLPKNPEENSLPQKIWRNVSTKKVWEGVSTKKYLEPWRQISTQQKLWREISTKQSPKIDFIPTPSQITLTKCANKTLKRNSLPKKLKRPLYPKTSVPRRSLPKTFARDLFIFV